MKSSMHKGLRYISNTYLALFDKDCEFQKIKVPSLFSDLHEKLTVSEREKIYKKLLRTCLYVKDVTDVTATRKQYG